MFRNYYNDLCSISLDTINQDNSILTIDNINYGKIGTTDGLYGIIGETGGSYGLIGEEDDNYISINNCISNTEINETKNDAFKEILIKVKERNDNFKKSIDDSQIYIRQVIY